MNIIWIKSNWTKAQLDQKRVENRMNTSHGIEQGIGEFWVRQNPEGLLAIEIVVETQGRDWAERIQTRYYPKQEAVGRIERHPDQSVADFRLFDSAA
jgi:hypothetical protein